METKKVQALNDDLLENIIGGISLMQRLPECLV